MELFHDIEKWFQYAFPYWNTMWEVAAVDPDPRYVLSQYYKMTFIVEHCEYVFHITAFDTPMFTVTTSTVTDHQDTKLIWITPLNEGSFREAMLVILGRHFVSRPMSPPPSEIDPVTLHAH